MMNENRRSIWVEDKIAVMMINEWWSTYNVDYISLWERFLNNYEIDQTNRLKMERLVLNHLVVLFYSVIVIVIVE